MRALLLAVLVTVSPMFIYMSCKQTTVANDCKEPVICTQLFAMVTLQVLASDGTKVTLDDSYTIRIKTGEKIRNTAAGIPGHYTVLDDSYRKQLANQTAEFRFIGIKDGKEIVNESYVISADCCHIKKQSGKTEIILP